MNVTLPIYYAISKCPENYNCVICSYLLSVDEMIAEVDIDGDGRIDFQGKYSFINHFLYILILYLIMNFSHFVMSFTHPVIIL